MKINVEPEDRYGYVCDCGGAVFQLTTPNEITCDECGLTIPDMIWVVVEDETE